MKKRLLAFAWALFAYFLSGSAQAQQLPQGAPAPLPAAGKAPTPAPAVATPAPAGGEVILERPGTSVVAFSDNVGNTPRSWVNAEYLYWWITNGPVGVPLVTTGNPAGVNPGALNDPGTRVLFGNSSSDFGGMSGGRISAGTWLGCDAVVGIEGSAFLFQNRTSTFTRASDATGNPLLALPFQAPGGVEAAAILAAPPPIGPQAGAINVTMTSRLWGADVNGAFNAYRECNRSLDLLAGFRYFDLQENLRVDGASSRTLAGALLTGNFFDTFNTRNQFYGGQVGARMTRQFGSLSADFVGLVALGNTHHTLNIGGGTTFGVNGAVIGQGPGGVYSQTTNIGNHQTNSFTVIPQMQIKVGYDITRNLRATVGYDALYWSNVNRPGNQIDRAIGAPGRPGVLDNDSSLWAHGLNAGITFRW